MSSQLDLRLLTSTMLPYPRRLLMGLIRYSQNGQQQPRKATLKVVQAKVVQMNIANDIDTKQARINHGLEMVRHA